jgi:probable HAF family extracellular repeat protein
MYDLNALIPAGSGWTLMSAVGVNETQITGTGYLNGQSHVFQITDPDGVFGNGIPAPVDLGGPGAGAQGMSPDGSKVVGISVGNATLWQGGAKINLGVLGGTPGDTIAYGDHVNNSAQVVGDSTTKSGVDRPFFWQNGTMTDLNKLVTLPRGYSLVGSTYSHGSLFYPDIDINNAGLIACGSDTTSTLVPVLLTPTTSPASAMTTSTASLTDATTPSVALAPVDSLVLDGLAHWLNAGAKGRRTPALL